MIILFYLLLDHTLPSFGVSVPCQTSFFLMRHLICVLSCLVSVYREDRARLYSEMHNTSGNGHKLWQKEVFIGAEEKFLHAEHEGVKHRNKGPERL